MLAEVEQQLKTRDILQNPNWTTPPRLTDPQIDSLATLNACISSLVSQIVAYANSRCMMACKLDGDFCNNTQSVLTLDAKNGSIVATLRVQFGAISWRGYPGWYTGVFDLSAVRTFEVDWSVNPAITIRACMSELDAIRMLNRLCPYSAFFGVPADMR
jgi:hypothetical protein